MTYKELHDQVLHLGFETTEFEIPALYVEAANRALHQVYALRPDVRPFGGFIPITNEKAAEEQSIRYMVNTVSADGASGSIQVILAEDLCSLLPLLVASYVWLEDEPERSQLYYSRYQERAVEILRSVKARSTIKYETNGW